MRITIVMLVLAIAGVAFAQTSALKSYQLARETKWSEARKEAENATKISPQDSKAWFMLGVTEERLENLDAAIKAYEVYLSQDSTSAAAKAVQNRIPELKARAAKKSEDVYGRTSNGFFIDKSLSYTPAFVDEVHGEMDSPLAFGFNFGMVYWGYRQMSGTYTEDLHLPNTASPPVYSVVSGGGKLSSKELFANMNFSLVDPYTSWGNMQLALPFLAGFAINTLHASANGTDYGNWEYDFGLGLALRGYTRSPFTWYVQGIYHIGIPFWGFKKIGTDDVIRNKANDDVKGSISGFETTAGIAFLFGADTTKHY